MRILITDEKHKLFGKMVEAYDNNHYYPHETNINQFMSIPKPTRTAWQWHELFEGIGRRGVLSGWGLKGDIFRLTERKYESL